ncbi:hypothetical protein GBA52_026203 [Prunus armeniaca]|nr:hypothetical protein GBA52_026203 [Prunus armeniaca]
MKCFKTMSFLAFMSIFLLQTEVLLCLVQGNVHYHEFILKDTNFTKLCSTKSALTVNESFPGPIIRAQKGDTVYVNVYNEGRYGVTLHWHGIKQPRNPWFDGPEYVTQCPIQPGTNFTYQILLSSEEGTLFWHAHSDWSRATVHGAFVILPANGTSYPFPKPDGEQVILFASWYKEDVMTLLDETLESGGLTTSSDSYTINGEPGDFYLCSNETTYRMNISGYYEASFPDEPPNLFNFTAEDLTTDNYTITSRATRVKMLDYNATVEITFQGTNIMDSGENHPVHLHGFRFYVIGSGLGNFNNVTDPLTYNLVDPPEVNTFPVPKDGWATIRFIANNPGVWFMHCHFDRHMSWGMDTVFIVKNGGTDETSIRPPPDYLPACSKNSLFGADPSMLQMGE